MKLSYSKDLTMFLLPKENVKESSSYNTEYEMVLKLYGIDVAQETNFDNIYIIHEDNLIITTMKNKYVKIHSMMKNEYNSKRQ